MEKEFKEFESDEEKLNQFDDVLDLVDIAEKMIDSNLLNKDNVSCDSFVMKQDKIVVEGTVEKRGKFNDIQWKNFYVNIHKTSEQPIELADGTCVPGSGSQDFYYQLDFSEANFDQFTEKSLKAKLSQFFEKYRSRNQKVGQ